MQQHLGDEFVGVISAVTEFGLFVTLKDLPQRALTFCLLLI